MSFLSDANKEILKEYNLDVYSAMVGQYLAFRCNGKVLFEYLEGELKASFTRREKKMLIQNLKDTHACIAKFVETPIFI